MATYGPCHTRRGGGGPHGELGVEVAGRGEAGFGGGRRKRAAAGHATPCHVNFSNSGTFVGDREYELLIPGGDYSIRAPRQRHSKASATKLNTAPATKIAGAPN